MRVDLPMLCSHSRLIFLYHPHLQPPPHWDNHLGVASSLSPSPSPSPIFIQDPALIPLHHAHCHPILQGGILLLD